MVAWGVCSPRPAGVSCRRVWVAHLRRRFASTPPPRCTHSSAGCGPWVAAGEAVTGEGWRPE